MKNLYSDDDVESVTISLLPLGHNMVAVGKKMWREISCTSSLDISITKIHLPKHPNQKLTATKIRSIANKYPTIPEEYRHYYPTPTEDKGEEAQHDCVAAVENGPAD